MSTTIKKQSKDKQILKKHVAAIHIGAKLSLLQRKLVNALLYNAYDSLLTAREHQISASVLCGHSHIKSDLLEALEILRSCGA